MSEVIAVAGKGGTGKTTITGMSIKYLCAAGKSPILAVDADANSNLNEVLGVEEEATLGDIREVIERANDDPDNSPIPLGMDKKDYLAYRMQSALIEEDDYDMIIMGRTQGKGCYCYVNDLLKMQLQQLTKPYNYIVVDNEAGMEHISRGTLPAIDTLLLVSDCSRRGIQAVARIAGLADKLKLGQKSIRLIVNRAPNGVLPDGVREEIDKYGLDLLGVVPQDDGVYEYDCDGKPTSELPDDNPVKVAVAKLAKELLGF